MNEPLDQPSPQSEPDARYDVVIIGGAFSGAATAIMLKRWRPRTRVLLVERSEQFSRKVGEATVEVSGLFITRVLGLSDHLAHHHLPKHGLRFWFDHGQGERLEAMGELGPNRQPGLASYHLDRSTFDQHLLDLADDLGVDVVRPGKITEVHPNWPESQVTYEPLPESQSNRANQTAKTSNHQSAASPNQQTQSPGPSQTQQRHAHTVGCRWIVDASGRNSFLGRRMGLMEKVASHPIAAAWARWEGVKDLDGTEVLGSDPRQPRLQHLKPSRALSTNHFCGYGWWCWMIPLPGGQTSIGLVYDKRLFEPPGQGKMPERYRAFMTSRPGLGQLLDHACMDASDFYAYKDLPYRTRQYMDKGWAMVGDAAAFVDPLYSSGLDHAAISTYATARIIEDELTGSLEDQDLDKQISQHNTRFQRSYDRWLEAIYQDKYALFGDPELTTASYLVDIGSYYLGVVKPMYDDLENFRQPVLGLKLPQAWLAYRIMSGLKARFIRLARTRRRMGMPHIQAATSSDDAGSVHESLSLDQPTKPRHRYPAYFDLGLGAVRLFTQGLGIWLSAELTTFKHRITHRRSGAGVPRTEGSSAKSDQRPLTHTTIDSRKSKAT